MQCWAPATIESIDSSESCGCVLLLGAALIFVKSAVSEQEKQIMTFILFGKLFFSQKNCIEKYHWNRNACSTC